MALTNFITSTLNVEEDRIENLDFTVNDNLMHISVTLKPIYPDCPLCHGKVKVKGYTNHTYNHLPIAGTPSVIEWRRRRYICTDCNKTFSETSPFGPENFHQSYAVLNAIALDLHNIHATYKDLATKHHTSPTLIQLYADSFIRVPNHITLPENLGIDEISSSMAKYGGSYLCVFVDNNKRVLNEILPNRSKSTLSKYFESIPKSERDKVKYVTIDMWEPYKDVCKKYLVNSEISVDPFHVIEHLTTDFSRIRVDIMNQCVYDSPAYYLLKSWHDLLEKDVNLDNEPKYNKKFGQEMNLRDIYNLLLDISPELEKAYQLKEMYRDFNKSCSYAEAPQRLDELIDEFEKANLYCYEEFVNLLKHWRTEIINSFRRPYDNRKQSNALSENINQKLKELLLISYGYTNFERYRARALYCLNDSIFYSLTLSLSSMKRKGKNRKAYNKEK